ncbi:unnamed protein product, partial [Cylicostephanus goldi]
MQKAHILTGAMEAIRFKRWKELLKRFSGDTHLSIVFGDEKIFTVEPVVNPLNDRVLASSLSEAVDRGKFVGRSAHPRSFSSRWSQNKQRCLLENFTEGHAEAMCCTALQKEIVALSTGFSASTYSKSCPGLMQKILPDLISHTCWPSNSSDLNPLDYSVWSVLESNVSSKRRR